MTPIALTVAGSDSSGGAGIQADLKTFSALGIYGASVVAALTAQNTMGVQAIHDVPAAFVAAQIDSVFSDLSVAAVKIGMLSQPAVIEAVADALARQHGAQNHGAGNIVLDPVMVSTSGARLIAEEAVAGLKSRLFPMAVIVTPNLAEAAVLLGEDPARSLDAMTAQGRRLLELGPKAVLVKGGHGGGADSVDVLVTRDGTERLSAPRHPTRNTHGTGCTLSAAIAAGLARGLELREAVRAAKLYLTAAIEAADGLDIGHGHGPVHHFHAWW